MGRFDRIRFNCNELGVTIQYRISKTGTSNRSIGNFHKQSTPVDRFFYAVDNKNLIVIMQPRYYRKTFIGPLSFQNYGGMILLNYHWVMPHIYVFIWYFNFR